MQDDTKVKLIAQLAFYGIIVINDKQCQFNYNGKKVKSKIKTKKHYINKLYNDNLIVALQIIQEINKLITTQQAGQKIIDSTDMKIFVKSLKGTYDLVDILCSGSSVIKQFCQKKNIQKSLRESLNRDCCSFRREFTENLVNLKSALDFVYRKNNILINIYHKIQDLQSMKKQIVTAQGAGGGMFMNVDLFMSDRVQSYDDIDSDFRDGQRQAQNQARYRNGIANYDSVGKRLYHTEDLPNQNNDQGGDGTWGGSSQGIWMTARKDTPYMYGDKDNDPYPKRPDDVRP